MEQLQTEGIILKAYPLHDFDRIIALFTPDMGLLKAVFKGRPRKNRMLSITPLVKIEISYQPSRGELVRCDDVGVLDAFPQVREKWDNLQAACEMAGALTSLLFPSKPAPALYALFEFYLQRLYLCPAQVKTSFYLKTLLHEGLLRPSHACSLCQTPLSSCLFADGEPFCHKHGPTYSIAFSKDEWSALIILATSRSFTEVAAVTLASDLEQKIKDLFLHTTAR